MGAEALAILAMGGLGLVGFAVLVAKVSGLVDELAATATQRRKASHQLAQLAADSARDYDRLTGLVDELVATRAGIMELERVLGKRLTAIENDVHETREDVTGLRRYVEGEETGVVRMLSRFGRTPRS